MDSQLKQRLTGAVILVVLAVVLVPELLTGPKPGAPGPVSSASAPVQGDGAPLRSYDIDLSDSRAAVAPAPVPALPPPSTAVTAGRAGEPTASPSKGARATVPGSATTPGPAAAGAAASPRESDPGSAAPLPAMRGFAVQVGSFASRPSADRLAADLRRRRFEAFVSPVRSGGRQLFRVRVGPVADRAAAQALSGQLKAIGQQGSVVPLP